MEAHTIELYVEGGVWYARHGGLRGKIVHEQLGMSRIPVLLASQHSEAQAIEHVSQCHPHATVTVRREAA